MILSTGELAERQIITIAKWHKGIPINVLHGQMPVALCEVEKTFFIGEPFKVLIVALPFVLLKPLNKLAVMDKDIPPLISIDTRKVDFVELGSEYEKVYKQEMQNFFKMADELDNGNMFSNNIGELISGVLNNHVDKQISKKEKKGPFGDSEQ